MLDLGGVPVKIAMFNFFIQHASDLASQVTDYSPVTTDQ